MRVVDEVSVMTAEQRAKRIERAQAEVDKLDHRRQRLEAQLAATRQLLRDARAELDWWQRPVSEKPQPRTVEESPS